MIAIVTTNKLEYQNYLKDNNIDPDNATQIARLSDIKHEYYTEILRIQKMENVCDYVINKLNK